jgi:hypothetical protein
VSEHVTSFVPFAALAPLPAVRSSSSWPVGGALQTLIFSRGFETYYVAVSLQVPLL